MNEYLTANRQLWDEWTDIHEKSPYYRIEEFKAGRCTLHSVELEELGDVTGKSLLHLQCHFGLDTMSWARRGAIATGVDFSEKAIKLAQSLSEEVQVPGRFLCSNIYDLPAMLDDRFDIVFTSYGVLTWLPDMTRWAQVVSHFLKPGGVFHVIDFHPFAYVFDDEKPGLRVTTRYFVQPEPLEFGPGGTYAEPEAETTRHSHEWPHSLSEIIDSLISAGLRIDFLHEFPFSVDRTQFAGMVQGDDGYWRLPEHSESVPLMFSIKCTKG